MGTFVFVRFVRDKNSPVIFKCSLNRSYIVCATIGLRTCILHTHTQDISFFSRSSRVESFKWIDEERRNGEKERCSVYTAALDCALPFVN